MSTKGVAPDMVTYSTAIKACGDERQREAAMDVLRELETRLLHLT